MMIPDLEEDETEDITLQVAAAPRNASRRLQSLEQVRKKKKKKKKKTHKKKKRACKGAQGGICRVALALVLAETTLSSCACHATAKQLLPRQSSTLCRSWTTT